MASTKPPTPKLADRVCIFCNTDLVWRYEDWKKAELLYCSKCKTSIYPGEEKRFSLPVARDTLFGNQFKQKRRR